MKNPSFLKAVRGGQAEDAAIIAVSMAMVISSRQRHGFCQEVTAVQRQNYGGPPVQSKHTRY